MKRLLPNDEAVRQHWVSSLRTRAFKRVHQTPISDLRKLGQGITWLHFAQLHFFQHPKRIGQLGVALANGEPIALQANFVGKKPQVCA